MPHLERGADLIVDPRQGASQPERWPRSTPCSSCADLQERRQSPDGADGREQIVRRLGGALEEIRRYECRVVIVNDHAGSAPNVGAIVFEKRFRASAGAQCPAGDADFEQARSTIAFDLTGRPRP